MILLFSHITFPQCLHWMREKEKGEERGKKVGRERESVRGRGKEGEGVGFFVSLLKMTLILSNQCPTLMISFNLSYIFRSLLSKYSPNEAQDFEIEFCGDTNFQLITNIHFHNSL